MTVKIKNYERTTTFIDKGDKTWYEERFTIYNSSFVIRITLSRSKDDDVTIYVGKPRVKGKLIKHD